MKTATGALLGATALVLAACGGLDDDPVVVPQLSAATGATLPSCTDLATRIVIADTTITAASAVAAGTLTVGGQPVPEHCRVTGRLLPRTGPVDGQPYAIGFEMRLPTAWNGRFWHQANGGTDGAVGTATGALGGGPTTHALAKGFAVLSSDAGHTGQGPNFGIDPQARLDYGYQAVGKLTPVAKEAIRIAYGKAPDRSYLGGCSNGGRHAMVAASRYANDYDGLVAGNPGTVLPRAAIANIAGYQTYAALATNPADVSTGFTVAERTLVSNAVLARCDALDGAADGMVQATATCQTAFSLDRDVPTCTGARDGSCLTAAQKTGIGRLFAGATTSTGTLVYAPFPWDTGLYTNGWGPAWKFGAPPSRDAGAIAFIWQVPPLATAGFDGDAFARTSSIDDLLAKVQATNATYTEAATSFMSPPNPTDLSALRNRGAKLLMYHGTADPIFSSTESATRYDAIRAARGGDASDFARLFLIPGMNHCSGGPATDQFDVIQPLVDWVERGIAPESITAQARGPGNPGGVNADVPAGWSATRTRPLCPYPQVARYRGTGSAEAAASFECRL